MKKVTTFLGTFLVASILLTSCGGGDTDNKKPSKTEAPLENKSENSNNGSSEDTKTTSGDNGSTSVDNSTSNTAGNCEQFCSDYEKIADDYVTMMKKLKDNPSDVTILTECQRIISKSADMQKNSKDCAFDPKIAARISKAAAKLTNAAAAME